MKVRCEYCGNMIPDTADQCPDCGAPNEHVVRTSIDTPKTIEELQQWYKQKGLPPYETTRFFIGIDYKYPRAFGIYKDSEGNYVVYKNKGDGQRAVRYKGTDEAYAVNELYMRLKQEIIQQKSHQVKNQSTNSNHAASKAKDNSFIGNLLFLIKAGITSIVGFFVLIIVIGVIVSIFDHSPSKGYYRYGGNTYYNLKGSADDGWYYYDSYYNWIPINDVDVPADLKDSSSAEDFYYTPNWNSETQISDFEDTQYYEEYQEQQRENESSSDDSSFDWDSGDSWDSDSTDWGSDW